MKKILTSIIAVTAIIQFASAQAPGFGWAKKFGGSSGYTQGYLVGNDASGNVYSTGLFFPSADFDPGPNVFNLTITGAPPGNYYVSKLDASGNFVWAKRLDDSLFVSSIAVSDAGNVLIMGSFGGTVDFDPGAGVVNRTADYNYQSTFILKLNSSGAFVWVDVFDLTGPGAGSAYVESGAGAGIAVDGSENVYLTGSFVESADMDPGAGTFNLAWTNNIDLNDGFLLKLNSSGAFVWAKRFGGIDVDYGHSVDVDAAGNVYVSGMFGTIANFDGTYVDAFFGNYFVYKVKSSGAFVWVKSFGNNQSFNKCFVKLDSKARPCLAGVFKGMADFDPGAATANLTAIGVNPFMSKLDSSGNFLWAKMFSSASNMDLYSIDTDASDAVYTSGSFSSTVDFDPGASIFNLNGTGGQTYFSKLDASGNFVWAAQLSAGTGGFSNSMSLDGSGNVYSTGTFNAPVDFDQTTGVFNLTPTSLQNAFVHKMTQGCTTCATPTAISSTGITSNKATINFTGNSCAVKYRVQYRVQGTTAWTAKTVNAPASVKDIIGLNCNTTYQYRIRTECNATATFVSPYSAIQQFVTKCQTPVNDTAANVAPGEAFFSWGGNGCAIKYRLQYKMSSSSTWITKTINAPATSTKVTGLTVGASYDYRVKSLCDATGTVSSGYTPIKSFVMFFRLPEENLNGLENSSPFAVWPNPTDDKITVRFNVSDEQQASLYITDIVGRKVYAENIKASEGENTAEIMLKELSKGLYMIRLTADKKEYSSKFLIE